MCTISSNMLEYAKPKCAHICKNTIRINMHKICINMQNHMCINMHFKICINMCFICINMHYMLEYAQEQIRVIGGRRCRACIGFVWRSEALMGSAAAAAGAAALGGAGVCLHILRRRHGSGGVGGGVVPRCLR